MPSTVPKTFPRHAVLLPATGSDDVLIRAVFAGPCREIGISLHAPAPRAEVNLLRYFIDELDEASAAGPVLAGGISMGAHLAAEWAAANPGSCAGLLLALPGWIGNPDGAPASLAARIGAENIERKGLEGALDVATAAVPPWLAAELRRAWPRQGDRLASALRAAADHPAPTIAALGRITVPAGVAACADDQVHPVEVAKRWVDALPVAALRNTTLQAFGADREALGRTTITAWRHAAAGHRQPGQP